MFEALTYDCLLNELKNKYKKDKVPIGILVARPTSKIVKEEIINDLDYFHHRTGRSVDFFFPGYGAYWNDMYHDKKEVCNLSGTVWYFSDEKFSEFISAIEQLSKWEYCGETELLIINYNNGELDFSNTTVLWIEKAIEDKAIRSARNLFESVFRAFRDSQNISVISDRLAMKLGTKNAIGILLEQMPYGLGKVYNKAQYFCTRNLSK